MDRMDKMDIATMKLTYKFLKHCRGVDTVLMVRAGLNLIEEACVYSDEFTRAQAVVFLRDYAGRIEKEVKAKATAVKEF